MNSKCLNQAVGFLAAFIVGFLIMSNPASADCGIHAIKTSVVPYLRTIEAMPLNEETLRFNSDSNDAPRRLDLHLYPGTCSDEKSEKQLSYFTATNLWRVALEIQNGLAYDNEARTKKPAVCQAIYKMQEKVDIYSKWVNYTGIDPKNFGTDRARLAALFSNEYFPHASELWHELAKTVGITLPAAGQTKSYPVFDPHYDKVHLLEQHLPDGIKCH